MKRSVFRALPSMDSLVIFEQAARHQSFTKAGAQLGLTQSAVSRQIIDLETMLNVSLFSRSRRQLQLTDSGQEFMTLMRPLLEGIEAAVLKMQLRVTQGNVMNLSVAASFCNMWFIPNLPAYYKECEGPQINVTPHVGIVDLSSGKFDAAIVNAEALPAGHVSMLLMKIALAPYAAPKLLPRGRRELAAMPSVPVLNLRESPSGWSDYLRAVKLSHLPTVQVGSHSLFLLNHEAARAGLGVALLPPELVGEDEERGRLVRLHPASVAMDKGYYLLWRPGCDKEAALQGLGKWMKRALAGPRAKPPRSAA